MSATTIAKKPYIIVSDHTTLGDINKLLESTPSDSCENLYGTQVKINGKYENILYISDKARAGIGLEQHRLFSTNFHLQRRTAYRWYRDIIENTNRAQTEHRGLDVEKISSNNLDELKAYFKFFDEVKNSFTETKNKDTGKELENYASAARAKQDKKDAAKKSENDASAARSKQDEKDAGKELKNDASAARSKQDESGKARSLAPLSVFDARETANNYELLAIMEEAFLSEVSTAKEPPMESNRRQSQYRIFIGDSNQKVELFKKSNNGETEVRYSRVPFGEDENGKKIWQLEGGQGTCWKFISETGNKKIVKIPNKIKKTDQSTSKHELSIGERLHSPQNNVLGFCNSVSDARLTDGICLISDFAENGSLSGFREKMLAAGISNEVQRAIALTVIKDMANGIEHIQKHDIVHQDLKLENVVIDADGRFQIIDFGLANERIKFSRDGYISNIYAAPETTRMRIPIPLNRHRSAMENQFLSSLKFLYPVPGAEEQLKRIVKKASRKYNDQLLRPTNKLDVYGIGQTAYKLLTGIFPTEEITPPEQGNGDLERIKLYWKKKKAQLSLDPESHGVRRDEEDAKGLVRSVGDPLVDSIIDVLLPMYPDNRIAAQDIGKHEFMKYRENGDEPAVGSKEIRDLIVAIASGKQKEVIHEKNRAFEAKFPPKESVASQFKRKFAQPIWARAPITPPIGSTEIIRANQRAELPSLLSTSIGGSSNSAAISRASSSDSDSKVHETRQ